jgi:hypothetical protein
MLLTTNTDEKNILSKFLRNWRSRNNSLPALVSVDMAWTILLNQMGIYRKPVDITTFNHYRELYSDDILRLYKRRAT